MTDLIIELQRVTRTRDFLVLLREEFESGGIVRGRFAIGDITAAPEMVYFLWHDAGEVPVSMLIEKDALKDEEGTRTAARDFIAKWKKRLQ